jgi:hypothetical protein
MGLIMKALASMAALSSLASTAALPVDTKQLVKRDACADGPHGNVLEVGGSTGDHFCEIRIASSGEIITGLEVWSDNDNGIRGILFTWSGGQGMMHGTQNGDSKSITFAPGEKVQAATLWGDGTAKQLGHIYLKTDKQEFDVGKDKPNDGYQIDVGSGLLLGASGNNGASIDSLALLFLATEISSVTIGGIKFDSDPTGTSDNIAPSYMIQSTMGNPSGSHGNVSFTVLGSEAVAQSTTWEQSTTGTFGMKYSIEMDAAPLGVGAKVTGGYEWSVAHTSSKATTTTDTITITQSAGPISIAPGFGKSCKIFAQKGTGTFPYSSTVTVNLVDGTKLSYQEPGKLVSVQYSQAYASCDDANNPIDWTSTTNNPPPGVQIVGTGN